MDATEYDCGGLGCGFQPCICEPLGVVNPSAPDRFKPTTPPQQNQRVEQDWRDHKIPFESFDWWLRNISGV